MCHNTLNARIYDSVVGRPAIRCPAKLAPPVRLVVASLCFIQALGSSDTMKKLLYGMVTVFFFANYGNSRAARATCRGVDELY